MTPQEVLDAAKQGNPQAIAVLMNQSLQSKGLTAQARVVNGCLHILVEGVTVPNQAESTPHFIDEIEKLGLTTVKSLAIYGRVRGENLPAWREWVQLEQAPSEPIKNEAEPVTDIKEPYPVASVPVTKAAKLGTTAFVLWTAAQSLWTKPSPPK